MGMHHMLVGLVAGLAVTYDLGWGASYQTQRVGAGAVGPPTGSPLLPNEVSFGASPTPQLPSPFSDAPPPFAPHSEAGDPPFSW